MIFKEIKDKNNNIKFGDLSNEIFYDNISINQLKITSLEGRPKEINGSFYRQRNGLTSLKYSPKKVKLDFDVYNNKLKSLKYCPEKTGRFNCNLNELTSLKYAPKIVNGDFFCSDNKLTTLIGRPKVLEGSFSCINNKLSSLKGIPKELKNLDCSHNLLTSLENCPEIINGNFFCHNNNLTSLMYCRKEIKGKFDCSDNSELKNVKEQIIKYQIKALEYITDEENFTFESIKKEFQKYKEKEALLLKHKRKIKINNIDYGLSI